MGRLVPASLLFVVLTGMTACGSEPESPVGEWVEEKRRRRGRRAVSCGFAEDGTCWGRAGSIRATGTWTQDGDTLVIKPDDALYAGLAPEVTIEEGIITVQVVFKGRHRTLILTRR